MTVGNPETLAEVTPVHQQRLDGITEGTKTALEEVVARSYDPEAGELAVYLGDVTSAVKEILGDNHGKVQAAVEETEETVEGLVTGNLGGAFKEAVAAITLSEAARTARNAANGDDLAALRAGLDRRLFGEAVGAITLSSAVLEINQHASTGARTALHLGLGARIFKEAETAITLSEALRAIGYSAILPAEAAMRRGLDSRVRREGQDDITLSCATRTIGEFSSTQPMERHMRIELNDRVKQEAIDAVTAHSGLSLVRAHATEGRRDEMAREVAGSWLPKEEHLFQRATRRLEEVQGKVAEFDEQSWFTRWLARGKGNALRAELKETQTIVDVTESSVEELRRILGFIAE